MKKISFGLLELEMANMEHLWRKTPLGPLGVKDSEIGSSFQILSQKQHLLYLKLINKLQLI
jgi:hypothetical protein